MTKEIMTMNKPHPNDSHPANALINRYVLGVVTSMMLLAPVAHAQGVQWTVAPYLWGASITVRGDVNELDVIDRTSTFSETLDDTDFAGMGYIEARGSKFGFFADNTYLNLGKQVASDVHVDPRSTIAPSNIEGDMKMSTLDAVGFYHPGSAQDGLDVYLGARMLDVDQKLDVTFSSGTHRVQVDKTSWNGIVGLRYAKMVNPRWGIGGRADIGAGDAKLTWNTQATAGWWFGERHNMSLQFGWKYMETKLESDDDEEPHVDSKIEVSGPLVGFSYRF
jgi:hypothetical protein